MPDDALPENDPMDIDPIDDGPIPTRQNNPASFVATTYNEHLLPKISVKPGEDARIAIDMLRSDDLSNRIAAAHKLDMIAEALGPQRTREVRF